jgi:uncharacterized protein (TIGR02246 family)
MPRTGIAIILCLICGAGTLAQQRSQRPKPKPPVRRTNPAAEPPAGEVKKVTERFRRAWEANDPDGLRQVCADDVVVIGAGRRDRGVDAVLDNLKANFQNFPHAEFQLGAVEPRIISQAAWVQADARSTLMTAHGSKLEYAGYVSLVLERQRPGWKITLADFDLRAVQAAVADAPESRPLTLEGAWVLESSTDVKTGQTASKAAMALFTKSRFSLFAVAPGRHQLKDKPLSNYSKKDLLEIVRGLEANAGAYQIDGNKLITLPTLAFLPDATGTNMVLENLKLTRDHFSYEAETREGRFEYVWRRIE